MTVNNPATRPPAATPEGTAGGAPSKQTSRRAAERAGQGDLKLRLPVLGELSLPKERGHLAWYAGVFLLGALEIVEWPVVAVLAAAKALADQHSSQALADFGQALDEGA